MADPIEKTPMLVVNTLTATDLFVFRAISKTENIMYVIGDSTLLRARKAAHELLRQGYLVHDPVARGLAKWIP